MQQRHIENAAMLCSALGLGCMGMSEFYGPADATQSLATLEHAFESGITLFDTADIYGSGHNERLIGQFLKGKRARLLVATKFGLVRPSPTSYERKIDNSPAYIRAACEASLKRLNIDTIDLYYIHRLNLDTPLEDSIGALSQLVKEGKIRAIGLSEVSVQTLRKAAKVHPIAAVQSEYSLWAREPENGMLQACLELGVAFFAYSPLGRGFLTGTITNTDDFSDHDFRRINPRFVEENFKQNLKIVESIQALATKKQCTPAQLALAWLLAQGPHVIPIPGTKRIQYLNDNLGALKVVLTPEELQQINQTFPINIAKGDRYNAQGMQGVSI
jgi:aryl-alcohol dehydrogenase-like predicted oxidoreductase